MARSNDCGAGHLAASVLAGSGRASHPARWPDWEANPLSWPGLDLSRPSSGLGGRFTRAADPVESVFLLVSTPLWWRALSRWRLQTHKWGQILQHISQPTAEIRLAVIGNPPEPVHPGAIPNGPSRLTSSCGHLRAHDRMPVPAKNSIRGLLGILALWGALLNLGSTACPPRRSLTWSLVSFSRTPEYSGLGGGWE